MGNFTLQGEGFEAPYLSIVAHILVFVNSFYAYFHDLGRFGGARFEINEKNIEKFPHLPPIARVWCGVG